ncbi:MAG: integrase arm-type DNA-binding domain-containing protein [Pseudomonadota bacterium]
MGSLTDLKVKKAKAGRHGDGGGLYLLVSKTGGKSWMLRTMVQTGQGKKRKDIGLGGYPLYSLSEAREAARELRKVAKRGGDPIAERDRDKVRVPTFREAAIECHAAKAGGWSKKNAAAFLSALENHAYGLIGDARVSDITASDVAALLIPIWTTKPNAGTKVRHSIGMVLDYSNAMAWRSDPAPRDALRVLLPKQPKGQSYAALPYEQTPAYVQELQAANRTTGRLALLFTIYTAARSGEVRHARWGQIDFDAALWNRPAELMQKNGLPHTVTLNEQALAILREVKPARDVDGEALVFPSPQGKVLSDMTLSKVVRPKGITVHGFRATFKTWAVEKMPSIPEAVSEVALSHIIPEKVERAYNRAKFMDMRRTLLDAWGRFLAQSSAEVVPLPVRGQS